MQLKIVSYYGREIEEPYTSIVFPKVAGPCAFRANLTPVTGGYDANGFVFTDNTTGDRWRYRDGAWLPTWPRKPRETTTEQGRARYERRYKNGK